MRSSMMNPGMKLGMLVGAALIGTAALAHPQRPPAPPAQRACEPTSPSADKKHEADAWNVRALDEALGKRGLKTVPMEAQVLTENNPFPLEHKRPDGETVIVAGTTEAGGQPVPVLIFAEDAARALFVIDVEPVLLVDETHLVCGCGPPAGGALIRRTFGYRIPKSRTFKGHLKVRVKQKQVRLLWSNTLPGGTICPMPP